MALRDDTVSMLTHTYPHKPLRRIKWPSAIIWLTAQFTLGQMFNRIYKQRKVYGHTIILKLITEVVRMRKCKE